MHRPHSAVLPRVAIVATALVILGTACSSNGSSATCGSGPKLLPSSPTALPTLDAHAFRQLLCQLHGKPVVVNVWASWCGPCIFEAPELATAARTYKGIVQFVGVDIQDQPASARTFIDKFKWTYPSVADPSGKIKESFGLLGVPDTMFFDANGTRTFTFSGPVTQEVVVNAIKGALEHAAPSGSASPGSLAPSPAGS